MDGDEGQVAVMVTTMYTGLATRKNGAEVVKESPQEGGATEDLQADIVSLHAGIVVFKPNMKRTATRSSSIKEINKGQTFPVVRLTAGVIWPLL